MDNGLSNSVKETSQESKISKKEKIVKFLNSKKSVFSAKLDQKKLDEDREALYERELDSEIKSLRDEINLLRAKFENSQNSYTKEHEGKYASEQEKERLQEAKKRYQTEIAILEQKNFDINSHIKSSTQENEKRVAVISGLKNDYERLSLQRNHFENLYEKIKSSALNYEKDIAKYCDTNQKVSNDLGLLEQSVGRIQKKNDLLQQNYQTIKKKYERLALKLRNFEKRKVALHKENDFTKNEIKGKEDSIGKLRYQILSSEEDIERLQSEKRNLHANVASKDKELLGYFEHFKDLENKRLKAQAELLAPKNELREKLARKTQTAKELQTIESQIKDFENENLILKNKISQENALIRESKKELEKSVWSYDVLKKENENLLEVYHSREEKKQELVSQNKKMLLGVEALQEKINQAKEDTEALNEIKILRDEQIKLRDRKETLLAAIEGIKQKEQDVLEQRQTRKNSVHRLKEEIKHLELTFRNRDEKIKSAMKDFDYDHDQIEKLMAYKSKLTSNIEQSQRKEQQIKMNISSSASQIRELQHSIQELKKQKEQNRSELNNLSSLMSERALKLERLKSDKDKYVDDNKFQQQRMNQISSKTQDLETRIHEMKNVNYQVDYKLKEATKDLDAKNHSNVAMSVQIEAETHKIEVLKEKLKNVHRELKAVNTKNSEQQKVFDKLKLEKSKIQHEIQRVKQSKEELIDHIELNFSKIEQIKQDLNKSQRDKLGLRKEADALAESIQSEQIFRSR